MDNKTRKVYVHINKDNGKKYVGIISKPKVEHRWNSGRGYKENTRFYAAIQKYGWDGFEHTHISQCCHGTRKTSGGYCWRFAQSF